MKIENINSLAQMIKAMDYAVRELEEAIKNRNVEKIKKSKSEILNLQSQIDKITKQSK